MLQFFGIHVSSSSLLLLLSPLHPAPFYALSIPPLQFPCPPYALSQSLPSSLPAPLFLSTCSSPPLAPFSSYHSFLDSLPAHSFSHLPPPYSLPSHPSVMLRQTAPEEIKSDVCCNMIDTLWRYVLAAFTTVMSRTAAEPLVAVLLRGYQQYTYAAGE